MRVFVTGATGVLGRRVLPMLTTSGHEVTAVARRKAEQLRVAGADPVELDLFDPEAVEAAVDGHEAVLDLATRVPTTNRMALPWSWRQNDRLRSVAATHLADAAIAAGARYVRESVGLLYADGGERWVGEDHHLDPLVNTRSALRAEAAAARVTAAGGVGVALRFALFYGSDSSHTRDQIHAASRGIAAILGDGAGYLPQVHLQDAARAVVAALDVPAGIYNIVEDDPPRRHDIVEVLEQIAGRRLRTPPGFLAAVGPPKAMARSLRLDNARFRAVTGWTQAHPDSLRGLLEVALEMDPAEGHARA